MNSWPLSRPLRLGTRQSPLALWQAGWVRQRVLECFPDGEVELVPMVSTGDRVTGPLHEHGGKALFVKELDIALVNGEVDAAVHSLKDVPGELAPGIALAAYSPREVPFDVLICSDAQTRTLDDLPQGAKIGTSAPRRVRQLLEQRPDFEIVPLRGNVGTRLQKLAAGECDAVVMAEAGLHRLGMLPEGAARMAVERMTPAVGQGVLALTTRPDDAAATAVVREACHDAAVAVAMEVERLVLARIAGDCHTPLACYATLDNDALMVRAFYASPDGARLCRHVLEGPVGDAVQLGEAMADYLLSRVGE